MTNFTNQDDVIDSRDIIARIEELETVKADFIEDCDDNFKDAQAVAWDESDDGKELDMLLKLQSDCEDYVGNFDGESLIKESYFETYIDDMLEDIGDLPKIPSYINFTINYADLKLDYADVNFNGEWYLIRCN